MDAQVLNALAALRQELFVQVGPSHRLDQLDLGVAAHREGHPHAKILALAAIGHVFDARRLKCIDGPRADAKVFPERLHPGFQIAHDKRDLGNLADLERLSHQTAIGSSFKAVSISRWYALA